MSDPAVPPCRVAACTIATKTGWTARPHVTRNVAGALVCDACGAVWAAITHPTVVLRLVENEWLRLATERRSAVVGHWKRPFLEWFDLFGLWDLLVQLLVRPLRNGVSRPG